MIEKLEALGVDVKGVLPIFLDDYDYYLNIFQDYLEKKEVDKLQESLGEGRYDEAMNYAYDIKSIAGTVGILDVYHIAEKMCIHMKEEKYQLVQQELDSVRESLKRFEQLDLEAR